MTIPRTSPTCRIHPAAAEHLPAVLALLHECNLPPDGLAGHIASTLIATQDQAVLGSAGLELYGDAALLRSVAVASTHRGTGLGRRLVDAALQLARARGVRRVYLLTQTAEAFFARFFAFRPTTRHAVDADVRQSLEFQGACPCSARVMVLELSSAQDISHKGVSPMPDPFVDAVRSRYAAVAESTLSSAHAGVRAVAEAFGYTPEELAAIPKDANMGLSCGNPTAMASLKPGETVVDLGCGGGLDVFLASQKVGPTGKAIGIDMTPSMIARAQKNAQEGGGAGFTNVEFHLATIDHLPLPDASVDVVISNCVINLAPDKPAVFREIARILKPGGRLAVSDIALKQPLPRELANDIMAYVGCIAGALLIPDYQRQLLAAGFAHVQVIDSCSDLNAYAKVENQSACCAPAMAAPPAPTSCCAPAPKRAASSCCCGGGEASVPPAQQSNPDLHARLKDLLTRYNVNDYAASVKVFALKPSTEPVA